MLFGNQQIALHDQLNTTAVVNVDGKDEYAKREKIKGPLLGPAVVSGR